MLKFVRISSLYPEVARLLNRDFQKRTNLRYKRLLKKVFFFNFGEGNKITNELIKKNYECNEIVANVDFLQNQWKNQYSKFDTEKDILLSQIKFYKPNIVYFANYSLINEKLISKIKKLKFIKLIMVFHCSPVNPKIKKKLKLTDLVITCTDGYQKEISKNVKKKVYKINHAFNVNKKGYENFKKRNIDITFIGSLYIKSGLHIKRINLIYNLIKKFDNSYIAVNFSSKNFYQLFVFLLSPKINLSLIKKFNLIYKFFYIYKNSKKPIYGKEMIKILHKTKILINSHIEDTKYAGNMRLFEGTGSGTLVLTDKKIGLNALFDVNKEIVVYKNISDLIIKCKKYLLNVEETKKIANNGKNKTMRHHSYKKRVDLLDKIIKVNI